MNIINDYKNGKTPLQIADERELPIAFVFETISAAIRSEMIEERRAGREEFNGRLSNPEPYLRMLRALVKLTDDVPMGSVLALEFGVSVQRAFEMLGTMVRRGWLDRIGHGKYEITDIGRKLIEE